MHLKQRYLYLLATLFFFLLLGVGTWAWYSGQAFQPAVPHSSATPIPTLTATPHAPALLDMEAGSELIIPSIALQAPVELVGADRHGRMQTPQKNPWEHVGWYRHGPIPGQPGSAVIDGHLDRPGSVPAVFWDLHKLKVNDVVTIKDKQERLLHFRVYETQTYTPTEAPTDRIFNDQSGTYLNLITCAGEWDVEAQQPSHRLVVYTRLEGTL